MRRERMLTWLWRVDEMVKDLKANVFPDRELRYVQVGVRGNEVRVA